MINRIKNLLSLGTDTSPAENSSDGHAFSELQIAAAVLLVEAAYMDENFDEAEKTTITRVLGEHFGLEREETQTLIEEAVARQQNASHLQRFTRTIKENYSEEERVGLLEMLWQVAYADGNLDHYEANLMRRIGGLIYVSDRDNREAKKRALSNLEKTN